MVVDSPTSDPSKYNAHVPLVSGPSVAGVNARMSSSARPVRVETAGLPVVEINKRPSVSSANESIFSAVALSSTSLPSKYMLKVPAVLLPSEVASNFTIS